MTIFDGPTYNVTVPASHVTEDLIAFPLFVDLSTMPDEFWGDVTNGGGGIRCYDSTGAELPREVVSCDPLTKTGELHVKCDLSATVNTVITIAVDGVSNDYAPTDPFGRHAVWSNGFVVVSHNGGKTDSTNNGFDGVVGGTVGGQVAGKLGGAAQSFVGQGWYVLPKNPKLDLSNGTLSAWVKTLTPHTGTSSIIAAKPGSYQLSMQGANILSYSPAAPVGQNRSTNTISVSNGNWHQVGVTFQSGVASGSTLFVDGVDCLDFSMSVSTQANSLAIGGYNPPSNGDELNNATLDEVRVSNVVRTAGWVAAEYANQGSPAVFYSVRYSNPSKRLVELDGIEDQVEAWRQELYWLRMAKPIITFYRNPPEGGAGLEYYGRVVYQDTIKASFPFKKNVSAQGVMELRFDHYISEWLRKVPDDPHERKNIVIRVDFFGGKLRWTGILHHHAKKMRDGMAYMELTFNDDLQFLQFLLGPPNPALPIPIFQFPRVLPILGPAKWACSIMVLINLIRKEGNVWQLPDDPFDQSQYLQTGPGAWDNWQVHIKCNPLANDDSSLWTVLGTRMNPIDSVLADALEDAQLTIRWRRIFTDEGEYEPGVLFVTDMANGALVFEIVDDSGYYNPSIGTYLQGTIVDGMSRSVAEYVNGFVEDVGRTMTDDESYYPDEYYGQGQLGTLAEAPWLVVRDNSWTPMATSELTWSPATAVSVIVGGDNPAADAVARLIIETTGNLLGYFLLGGFSSAGSIAADVIMPFLNGTIMAWLEWKNSGRAKNLGWVHLWELYQQGAENNSWSLSALAALRGGFIASKSQTSHTLSLQGHTWIIPGAHFQIGSRIGSTCRGYNDKIFVAQCEEIIPGWDNTGDSALMVQVKIGQNKAAMSVGERLARLTKRIRDITQNIGVHLVT